MAFTAIKTGEDVCGSQRRTYGTYLSDGGDTGGNINTGLHQCTLLHIIPMGSAVQTDAPVVNATFPCDGAAVAIKTDSNTGGYWEAWGY